MRRVRAHYVRANRDDSNVLRNANIKTRPIIAGGETMVRFVHT